jgi:hypothetical protein
MESAFFLTFPERRPNSRLELERPSEASKTGLYVDTRRRGLSARDVMRASHVARVRVMRAEPPGAPAIRDVRGRGVLEPRQAPVFA